MLSHKKRKLVVDAISDECFKDIIAEVDVEIGLRQRLAETLESRITWALILQESLQKGSSGSTASFKDAAFDALAAIETPSNILFTHEDPPPPSIGSQQSKAPRPPPRQKNVSARNPGASFLYIKSADLDPPYDENRVQTYLLRCPECLRMAFTSLQGLLNHARISHGLEWGTHDECVRACAVIDQDVDFQMGIEVGLGPSGLLPGLRSLFQMAVSVQTPSANLDNYSDAEARPSLESTTGSLLTRTLGLHQDTPALASFLGKQATRRCIKVWDQDNEVVDIDVLEDGSGTNSRSQMAMDEIGESNIDERQPRRPKRVWRMPYAHRNNFEHPVLSPDAIQTVAPIADSSDTHRDSETVATPRHLTENADSAVEHQALYLPGGAGLPTTSSRFHFVARIVITDRSLWLPPERRPKGQSNHTHKWMISVDSPSYSHHITTILQRLTVTSVSDSSSISPISTTTDPPFVVIGTTDQPFLARVELCFGGTHDTTGNSAGQTVVLEHWVELDLLRSANATVGEEQVLDVELDKGTRLMPLRKAYTQIGAKVLWNLESGRESTESIAQSGSRAEATQGYERVLTDLLGRFPMTLKDTKSGRFIKPRLPYKLVSTAAQLKNLVVGRRKAIEWGRASALREAYNQAIQEDQYAHEDMIPLTTGDVYAWLADGGHFLQKPSGTSGFKKGPPEKLIKQNDAGGWCHICGQSGEVHLPMLATDQRATDTVKMERNCMPHGADRAMQSAPIAFSCNVAPGALRVTKMPMIDVGALLETRLHRAVSDKDEIKPNSNESTVAQLFGHFRVGHLIAASDPRFTLAVRRIVLALKLPSFAPTPREVQVNHYSHSIQQYPLNALGENPAQVESHLAPHAILALLTKRFIRALVEGGLEVAKREKAIAANLAALEVQTSGRRRSAKESENIISILTPVHVLSAVTSGVQGQSSNKEVAVAVFGYLARMGIGLRKSLAEASVRDAILGDPAQEDGLAPVKMEQF